MKKALMVRTVTHPGHTARLVAAALFATLLSAAPFHAAFAQTAPSLGSAGNFAVLAGTAVTCTDSTVTGDVGLWSNTPITQTNCTINGTTHQGDASAVTAYNDFLNAYDSLALNECGQALSGTLAGATLTPGVYCFDAAATLTGQLTLDGPANGVWIFKIGTSGTGALTGTNFSVVMSGGGQACNVYWWVAEAATMTTSNFQGTVLAGAATTFTGGSLIGRDLAKAAATLTGVTVSACSPGTPPAVCKDSVTGKGWIILPDGSKGAFSVSGGIKHGKPSGHLTYVDHGLKDSTCSKDPKCSKDSKNSKDSKCSKVEGMTVKGTGVTAYTVIDAVTRHIEGTAEINGKAGYTYQVDVVDSAQPGGKDMFSLRLSNNYSASGDLAGGNIRLHKKCRPLICLPFDEDNNYSK